MILFGVFELSAESDLKDAQKRVEDKAEYIKTQYITYQKYNASNVTKSLDRLIDKTQQVRRAVARPPGMLYRNIKQLTFPMQK